MKLQNIYINSRYDYVVDYECSSLKDWVENFVIEKPITGNTIDLAAFTLIENQKDMFNNLSSSLFVVETDGGAMGYYVRDEKIECTAKTESLLNLKVELTFSLDLKEPEPLNQNNGKKTDDAYIFNQGSLRKTIQQNVKEVAQLDGTAILQWKGEHDSWRQILQLQVSSEHNSSIWMIELVLHLEVQDNFGKRLETRTCRLFVGDSRHISDVVIDFGSEATQMAIYKRSEDISLSGFTNLFNNIKNSLVKGSAVKNADYYQYDPSDSRYYRSQYFIRKKVKSSEVESAFNDLSKAYQDDSSKELLKVLTSKEEVQKIKDDYFVSPNIKLSSFGGIVLPKVDVDGKLKSVESVGSVDNESFYYRASISLFTSQALDSIIKDGSKLVSFHILMPNVYPQVEIVRILRMLQKDIDQMIKKKYEGVLGFDVTAVSESDASLIGVCEVLAQSGSRLPDGNYLMLDAGKGTLDFSLVKYVFNTDSNTQEYHNLWRAGIIGAGNSLTYAYLLALVHKYLELRSNISEGDIKEADIQQFIYANILGLGGKHPTGAGDPAHLLSMMRAVDRIKCWPSNGVKKPLNKTKDDATTELSELQLGAFVSWLENECINAEENTVIELNEKLYIDSMIKALVEETVNKIQWLQEGRGDGCNDYQINGVVFSGRAFKLKKFKDEMFNRLCEIYSKLEEKSFLNDKSLGLSMKNICLVGVNPIKGGLYNRRILSEPYLFQSPVWSEESIDEELSGPFKNIKKKLYTLLGLSSTSKTRKIVTPSSLGLSGIMEGMLSTRRKGDINNQMPLKGYEWNLVHPENAFIYIGGVKYPVTGMPSCCKLNLFFNGEMYLLRSNEKSALSTFDKLINTQTSPFLQSSFFPNMLPETRDEVELVPKDCNSHQTRNVMQDSMVEEARNSHQTYSEKKNLKFGEKPNELK